MKSVCAASGVQSKSVFKVALPVLVESCLRILLGNVDQLMLSNYSDTAVAAVGNANQIMNMGFVALEMIGTATTILLAQYIGAKREKEAEHLYTLSLAIIVLFSLVLTSFFLVFRQQIFVWMNLPQELLEDAGAYLSIVGGTILFQGVFMGISAILRSHVMMREIMVVSIGMNVINVAVNYMLINGYGFFPRMGVVGAALATALSRAAGAALLGWLMVRRLKIRLNPAMIRHPDFAAIRSLFRVGLPAAGDSISYNCMQIVLLALINTFGTAAVTSKVYVGAVLPFVYIFATSLATATQIKVGYFVGAKEPEKAQRLVPKNTVVALCVSLALILLLYFGSDTVFSLFTHDAAVLAMIRSILLIEIFLELGRAVNVMMIRALLSAGDTAYPLYCALVSMWGVGVLLSFLLGRGFGMGIIGVWIGMAADEWCRALAFLLRWKSGKWKEKRLL